MANQFKYGPGEPDRVTVTNQAGKRVTVARQVVEANPEAYKQPSKKAESKEAGK